MSPLRDEVINYLETMEPDALRASGKLDARGLEILAELERDMNEADAFFKQDAQAFRDANPVPEIQLPNSNVVAGPAHWWRKRSIPNGVLAAAVVIAGFVIIFDSELMQANHHQVRSGSLDMDDIKPLNEKLVQALIDRVDFLMDAGNQTGEKKHYLEALYDLQQAHELEPENADVLRLLALIHEKLGNDKKAEQFYEMWQTHRDDD